MHVSLGHLVTTLADDLRVRSKPSTGGDSTKYVPTLPSMSDLVVTSEAIPGDGYWWYRVHIPGNKGLEGGIKDGWIACAGLDGTPWITQAEDYWGSDVHISATVQVLVDRLSLRSQPRIGADSLVYRQLSAGIPLLVIDGPAEGSGYWWYEVLPLDVVGLDPPRYGWVAAGSQDGTESWIGHDFS